MFLSINTQERRRTLLWLSQGSTFPLVPYHTNYQQETIRNVLLLNFTVQYDIEQKQLPSFFMIMLHLSRSGCIIYKKVQEPFSKSTMNLCCMLLERGRKPEYPEESHSNTKNTRKHHAEITWKKNKQTWDHCVTMPLVYVIWRIKHNIQCYLSLYYSFKSANSINAKKRICWARL